MQGVSAMMAAPIIKSTVPFFCVAPVDRANGGHLFREECSPLHPIFGEERASLTRGAEVDPFVIHTELAC